MKHFFIVLIALVFGLPVIAQNDGHAVLVSMHKRHARAMCQNYTFSQRNTHYQNDTVIGNSVWHESVGLPDRFRIFFGDPAKGNSVFFRNDSVYRFKNSAMVKSGTDSNNVLLLLGGMYYRELEDVQRRLKAAGYDLSKFSEQKWAGRDVYVLGAGTGDLASNQFWVDKKDLQIVRIIEKLNEKDVMDMRFESRQKWCRGFVENKVSFRRNGMLEQVEEYFDLKETEGFR